MDSLETKVPPQPLSPLQVEVLVCLARGGAVVAANPRSARWLRQVHGAAQQAAGRAAWPTPAIYDWDGWLAMLWNQRLQRFADAPLLLTPIQERAVWKKIVATHAPDEEAVAAMASRAWELLSDSNAHSERRRPWSGSATTDAEVFRGWAAAFERECRRNRWVSRGDLAALLARSIQAPSVQTGSIETGSIGAEAIELPPEILLLGFDRLSPARQELLAHARSSGTVVSRYESPGVPHSPQMVAAADLRDELTTCAWWARRILESDRAARIAIIVQNGESIRGEIDRTFRRILMPESVGIEATEAMPFEFSLGSPLAQVPVVRAALLLLRWVTQPLEELAITWLMLSGFLAAEGEDAAEMADLDVETRRYGRMPPLVPMAAFAVYRPRQASASAGRFLARLRGLQQSAQSAGTATRARTFAEWIDFAGDLLKQARWPGSRALDSAEFQALDRWERLTGDLAGLAFDGARVAYGEFVTVLDRYAEETIFSPQSHNAPVQVMGASESSGQEFDAIWFLGTDDGQWPAAAMPNPLLPLWLQRKAGMPHASLDEDWRLGLAMTRRIAASAKECVFSYAVRDQSGGLRSSALPAEAFGQSLAQTTTKRLRAELGVRGEAAHRCATEAVEDTSAIPWPRELDAGGSEVLRRQSACGFQSFATRRLSANELDAAERGLNMRDRGTIVHRVLEAVWSKTNAPHLLLETRADLVNAKVAGRLPSILDRHIDAVFAERAGANQLSEWSRQYLDIERARLRSVLLQWFEYEADCRQDFVVGEHEKKFPIQINGLKLNLRVDRIDLVDDGRIIVDYKTGEVSPSMWDGDRPDDPQMPLYGIHGPVDDLRGVLFAQIRAQETRFTGRAENATAIVTNSGPSGLIRPLDEETLGEWSDALSGLADRFLAGDADVAPKSYPQTCKYCALPGLCRIAETFVVLEPRFDPDADADREPSLAEGDDADD